MDEEKTVSGQELDKAAGGAGGNDGGFEAAWEEYAINHCCHCAMPESSVCGCELRKARAAWAEGKPIECTAYMGMC